MKLRFTKMHGAGNDFVVIDAISQSVALSPAGIRHLADRHRGVGADQILLVERPAAGVAADFGYRIFNADGGEVEQCGNGARCFVRFVVDKGLTTKRAIRVATLSGIIEPRLEDDGRVTVDMGAPVLEHARIPFDPVALHSRAEGRDICWPLGSAGRERWFSVLSMGNPHAVCFVDDVDAVGVAHEGALIERSAHFPARVNVGFAQPLAAGGLKLRVWERGAGETLACGTGACAAAVSAIRRGLSRSPVAVHTRGGLLSISWDGGPVLMTGPAETVFDGEIDPAVFS
jgi:diaminopimelate epimerase